MTTGIRKVLEMAIIVCSCGKVFKGQAKSVGHYSKVHLSKYPDHRIIGKYSYRIPDDVKEMVMEIRRRDRWQGYFPIKSGEVKG